MFSLVASASMVLNGKWWQFIVAVVSFSVVAIHFGSGELQW